MSYELLKILHILGIVIFIGNMIISTTWKIYANLSNNITVIQWSTEVLNIIDIIFTITSLLLILISGHFLMSYLKLQFSIDWIFLSYILFIISGFIWLILLLPIQFKQKKIIENIDDNIIPKEYDKLNIFWSIFGMIVIVITLIILYLMIFKPTF